MKIEDIKVGETYQLQFNDIATAETAVKEATSNSGEFITKDTLWRLLGEDNALVWLNTPSVDLSGEKPNVLILTGHAESVLTLITLAELGVPS